MPIRGKIKTKTINHNLNTVIFRRQKSHTKTDFLQSIIQCFLKNSEDFRHIQ